MPNQPMLIAEFLNGLVYCPQGKTVIRDNNVTFQPDPDNARSTIRCSVYRIVDSIDGIFEAIRIAVLEGKNGSFRCLDFTNIRPNGAKVEDTGGFASGPVSFLRVWEAGAVHTNSIIKGIAILADNHADIEEWKAHKSENLIVAWYTPYGK